MIIEKAAKMDHQQQEAKATPKSSELVFDREGFLPQWWASRDLLRRKDVDTMDTSVIIATYNRCPFPELNRNPLYACLRSLLTQRAARINEIIIVGDGCADFTSQHISRIKERAGVSIRWLPSPRREGSPRARNRGLRIARSFYVFFCDDDCLLSPFALAGAQLALRLTTAGDCRACLMHLPVYHRDIKPGRILPMDLIGSVDLNEGIYGTNFSAFPKQYLRSPDYLDHGLRLLKPFCITHPVGVFIAEREALLRSGGFPEYFTWSNAFTEELELGRRLMEQGNTLYMLPDPKCFATHLKWGHPHQTSTVRATDEEELRRFLSPVGINGWNAAAARYAHPTGNRVALGSWSYSKLISYFTFFGQRNRRGARRWMDFNYEQFVEQNSALFYSGQEHGIPQRKERRRIWNNALRDGSALLEQLI